MKSEAFTRPCSFGGSHGTPCDAASRRGVDQSRNGVLRFAFMLVSVSTCSNRSNRTTSWSRPLPTSPNTWLTPAAMDTMGLDDLSFGRRTIVPNCGDARLRGESASPKIVGDVFRRDAILVAMLFDSLRRRFAGRIGPAHQREIAMKSAGRDHWAACNTAAIEFQIANCAAEAIRYKFSDQEYALPPRFIRSHRSAGPKM